jgi:hypothetical protein
MLLRLICIFILLGILVAGLWPFYAPENEVAWADDGNGVLFGAYGSIVSEGRFAVSANAADRSCSFEVWLGPRLDRPMGTVFAFYSPDRQVTTFLLRQAWGNLSLQLRSQDQHYRLQRSRIYIDGLYGTSGRVLITVTSGRGTTSVYADGKLVKTVTNFVISNQDMTGQLIAGNSAMSTSNWSGQLSGLAIYDRELRADEISRHYEEWGKSGIPEIRPDERAIALYPLHEGGGSVVHNQVSSATDLLIPKRFFILHKYFLERPWDEFRWDSAYLQDIVINVGGFIPFGFFFCAYFTTLRKMEHSAAISIAFGFLVSLIIEISQGFLPTRNSGMTDLITNTLGTAVGVLLFRWKTAQAVLARFS